ncbi:MAG: acyl-ACP--UDP-N-acetylglucosamine O-acyltransferase [Verrucomicrobiota bacterium]
MKIHPTAIIDPGAVLGAQVSIGPFAVIEGGTAIGDHCVIGPHAVISRYTSLGPGCRVHAGAVLGDVPQDVAFKDVESYLKVGAGCIIREGVTIHRGTKAGTSTMVGDRCFLMALSHLGHNVQMGDDVIVVNGALLAGYVEVGSRAFISGHAGVHQFTRIGRLAMVSGCSAISKDVPPFCTARAASLNWIAGLNVVGMRRAGIAAGERQAVRTAFKVLYRSGLNVSQALSRLKEEFKEGPARELWEFVAASKRGICAFGGSEEADDEEQR